MKKTVVWRDNNNQAITSFKEPMKQISRKLHKAEKPLQKSVAVLSFVMITTRQSKPINKPSKNGGAVKKPDGYVWSKIERRRSQPYRDEFVVFANASAGTYPLLMPMSGDFWVIPAEKSICGDDWRKQNKFQQILADFPGRSFQFERTLPSLLDRKRTEELWYDSSPFRKAIGIPSNQFAEEALILHCPSTGFNQQQTADSKDQL